MGDNLLTPAQAAALCCVSLRTFNRSVAGKLPKVRPSERSVRYRAEDVRAYLDSRTQRTSQQPATSKATRRSNVEKTIAANPVASKFLRSLEKHNAA